MEGSESGSRSVIIIGGGIIGCSVAYQLSLRGYKPIIVDREPNVASGASGKAGGFLAREWSHGRETEELTQRSFDLHKEHAKVFANTGYRAMDAWSVSVHPKGGKKKLAAEKLNWVDSACVSGLSRLSSESTTAQVHPQYYTEAIFAASLELGAKFVQAEAIRFLPRSGSETMQLVLKLGSTLPKGVEQWFNYYNNSKIEDSDRESGRESSGEFVVAKADLYVICMGCWSDILLSEVLENQKVMSAIRATSIVLKPHEEVPNIALFTDWFCPGGDSSYDPEVYPRPDNTLYICARADPVDVPIGGTISVVPSADVTSKITDFAAQLSPLLVDAPIISTQACLLPTTADDVPIIGTLIPSQLYVATGHSCWGILNAPATGEAMAQLIHEGKSEVDLSHFDPLRFLTDANDHE